MPEITSYRPMWDAVYVDSFGTVTMRDVQQSIVEVSALLLQHRSNRLIVDVRKQSQALELLDTFNFCKDDLPILPSNLQIAYIVANPPLQSHQFFTLMSNSLGYPVLAFYEIDAALYWFDGQYDPTSNPFYGKVSFPSVSAEHKSAGR